MQTADPFVGSIPLVQKITAGDFVSLLKNSMHDKIPQSKPQSQSR